MSDVRDSTLQLKTDHALLPVGRYYFFFTVYVYYAIKNMSMQYMQTRARGRS